MLEKVDWFSFVFGGVVIAFIVNIISSFAQPKIETWLEKYNAKRRNKNTSIRKAFEAEVQRLSDNNHEELVIIQTRNFFSILYCTSIVFVMGFLITAIITTQSATKYFLLVGELIASIFSILLMQKVNKISQLLKAVGNQKNRPKV
ncbi:MAG: hypothetical protein IH589_07280 [Anaerolineales bacterium]|nr:hypothetical protein [Anaerolineales bacterium]